MTSYALLSDALVMKGMGYSARSIGLLGAGLLARKDGVSARTR